MRNTHQITIALPRRTAPFVDRPNDERLPTPAIARREYSEAKAQFDKGEFTTAATQFERVLAVIGEAGAADSSLADLRVLSEGFAKLAAVNGAATPPEPSPSAPRAEPPPSDSLAEAPPAAETAPGERGFAWRGVWAPPPAVETSIFDATHSDVVPPEEVSRFMPPWTPRTPMSAATTFRGTIQIVIDEQGEVTSVTLAKPLTPEYDNRLLAAARNWKFRPAMREGTPVKYTAQIDIVLRP